VEGTDSLEKRLPTLFASDVALPVQYHWALRHRCGLEGERKLMFAVLEDGVRCYLRNMEARSPQARILFLEVRDWITAETNNGPFSFDLLCQEFGMDGAQVRNALEERFALEQA
jgi:hypothetical protein